MKQGWFKLWRTNVEEDMYALDPYAFKLWIYLFKRAQHTPFMDLKVGQCRVRIRELAEIISGNIEKPASTTTVMKALKVLKDKKYITVLEARPGRPTLLAIKGYERLTGEDESVAVDHEYPEEDEDTSGIS